ncbi:MAG: hypothetical protein QXN26_01160 [Thermoplasmataceae archaeon]|jgi:hypothetical protein|uniref:hypothetical protein n=1 Tax=Archaea TaxID=2157 RepID=UPI0000164E97|nr:MULTISPECIES: hypothetical protein [Thermoplasmatales]WMT49902.1 MAG: hypothetical protein RE472_02780 [Thermoplasmatales archaeon]WMT52646.1 MAG: hypothetical protein RE473_06455 [Ferroplasma acidiphilum]
MTRAKDKMISIRKSDLDSLLATIETLENQYVMDQLRKSEDDIRKGRVRNAREFLQEQI